MRVIAGAVDVRWKATGSGYGTCMTTQPGLEGWLGDVRAALLTRDHISRQAAITMAVQIADRLHVRIEDGDYPPGTRLPSAAALAGMFGVHQDTARQALRSLVTEGVAVYTHGLGHFTA